MKKILFIIATLIILIGLIIFAQHHVNFKSPSTDKPLILDPNPNWDYVVPKNTRQKKKLKIDSYHLALSWSPTFCSQKINQKDQVSKKYLLQCKLKAENKWVIHGLWPQTSQPKNPHNQPRFCQGDLPPLNPKIMQKYLDNAPGYALLQGEWEKHGSCAFPTADDYFAKQESLYLALRLPKQTLNAKKLKHFMQVNNPKLARVKFKTTKSEIQICYDLKWQYINCP